MHHRAASESAAPLSDLDRQTNPGFRARKMSSTGGNRSWSEEEENYLLKTRQQKMPYKHIAAHLKKTELACRLHYHQLSHGSHRRKRTASVSSTSSSCSAPSLSSTLGQSPMTQSPAPIDEEPASAGSSPRASPGVSFDTRQAYPVQNTTAHKPLLPKPNAPTQQSYPPRPNVLTPQSSPEPALPPLRINTNTSPAVFPPSAAAYSSANYPSASSYSSHQFSAYPSSTTSSQPSFGTSYPQSSLTPSQSQPIDPTRLHKIYEAHRTAFWSAVAADYGPDASPALLEDVWKRGLGLLPSGQQLPLPNKFPPSPDRSPDGSITRWDGWSKVELHDKKAEEKHEQQQQQRKRSGSAALAIGALLTEDKNPRPEAQ